MKQLKTLYTLCGLLSGLFMILICMLIVTQIIARIFGSMVPATDELAGYGMAASGFLGLPYALHRGSHIRVSLIMKMLPEAGQRILDVVATLVGLAIAGYLAWYCTLFVHESYAFNEVSSGLLIFPLWIPQLPMAAGAIVLVIAMVDRLITLLQSNQFEAADASTAMSE